MKENFTPGTKLRRMRRYIIRSRMEEDKTMME
jgi:hypothetical protein